jgi:hypothetical protein
MSLMSAEIRTIDLVLAHLHKEPGDIDIGVTQHYFGYFPLTNCCARGNNEE